MELSYSFHLGNVAIKLLKQDNKQKTLHQEQHQKETMQYKMINI